LFEKENHENSNKQKVKCHQSYHENNG